MTISYLIDYDLDDNSGVIQKIKQQSSQWKEKGHMVYFVSTKTMSIYSIDSNIIFEKKPLDIKYGRFGTAVKLLYSSYNIYSLLEKIEFDLIYMRYRLYMPFMSKVLKKYKVIMEINSDDTVEYKLHSKLTDIYNRATRDFFLKDIDAFVSVSHELKEKFLYLDRPIEVIANGINVEVCKIEDKNNKVPTLVFIGSPNQSWHGLDKIVKMAEHFKEYLFYIIGTEGKDGNNIKYCGYLSKEESRKIISQCDIGISTLSLYKKYLTEASPLKSRQYLACGLPLIYAYRDTDIPNDVNFGLKLENSEGNLDYQRMELFIQKVFKNKDVAIEAKKFAEETLDYAKKENLRLHFFQEMLDEK